MTSAADRREMIALINDAMADGARQAAACAELGLDSRTLQRWTSPEGEPRADRHPFAARPVPANRLTEAERDRIVATCNSPELAPREALCLVPRTGQSGCA